jgi:hypothetical protein
MRKLLALSLVALTLGLGGALSLMGCGGHAALLQEPNPIYTQGQPMPYVRNAIMMAVPQHRWRVESEDQNRIVAGYYKGSHVARVLITYDQQNVSVQFIQAQNLSFQVDAMGNRYIHRNYNVWVGQLANDIQRSLYAGMGGGGGQQQQQVPVIVVQ